MARGKGIILLLCVFTLLPKISSVEKSRRDWARAEDGNETSKNEADVVEKQNLRSQNTTFFPTKMKPNRNAKVNLGNCCLKVKWF